MFVLTILFQIPVHYFSGLLQTFVALRHFRAALKNDVSRNFFTYSNLNSMDFFQTSNFGA
jgi:hypothetical protein